MSELAIKLINEAYEKQSTFLDLGCCGLTEIPKEIVKLKDCLQNLNLGQWYLINEEEVETANRLKGNYFLDNSSSLGLLEQLQSLTTLSLFNTGIDDKATEYISSFFSLTTLDLTENNIEDKGAENISRLLSLTSLSVALNNIGEKGIGYFSGLSSLVQLNIAANYIGDKGVKYIGRLTNLDSLNITQNDIGEEGATYISALPSLSFLNISNNKVGENGARYVSLLSTLKDLQVDFCDIGEKGAEHISRISSLTSLSISTNDIGEKGAEYISKLSNLNSLTIVNNDIGVKGAEHVSRLANLHSLNITNNNIGDKGCEYISTLSSLVSLSIANNNIGINGAEYISKLSKLYALDISYNNIGYKGAAFISRLHLLTSLEISENNIGEKGAKHISKLSFLTSLDIDYNKIGDNGAAYISKLLLISELNLAKNYITTFTPEASASMSFLNLQENRITHLSLNFVTKINLEIETEEYSENGRGKLFLWGNPIENIPPEVMHKGRAAILEYLEGDLRPLNECKLIFVGDGGVGKTSLMKRLVESTFTISEGTTHGINKIAWHGFENAQGEPIRLNLWDFGGQHIQHSLHQFFFTQRVVYVLVLNPRNDEKAAYWLDQVDKLGFGSQLIIVYNWKDRRDIEADYSRNFQELRKAYKYLPEPIVLSCKTGEGMDVFTERVQTAVLANEGLKTEYPETWFNIKQKLEKGIPIEKHYIEYQEYEAWCAEEQYNDPERRLTLLRILDSVGAIVFFDKPVLNNLQVLNPEWISTGAYAILTSDITREKKGHLSWADLQKIFSTEKEIFSDKNINIKYTEGQFNFILQLMLDYRLCQKNPLKEHEYLIPSAFGERPKKEYDTAGGRHYRLKFSSAFEMLVIHRFIAKNIVHIQGEDYWHSGIYFKHATSNTWVLVETSQYSQEINCWIKGDNIRGLWEVIRNDFREIFNMYHNLPVEEEVEYTSGGQTVFLKYNQMIAALRRGVRVIQYDPATELENIDVLSVMELFESPKEKIRQMSNEQIKVEVNPVINVSPRFTNNPQITASPTITASPEIKADPQITVSPTITGSPVQNVTAAEAASPKDQPKPTTRDVAAEDKKVRQWKNKALITFICSVIITGVLVLVWIKNWWLDATQWKWLNDHDLVKWIGGVLAFAWNSFIAKALYDRFWDKSKEKAYCDSLRK